MDFCECQTFIVVIPQWSVETGIFTKSKDWRSICARWDKAVVLYDTHAVRARVSAVGHEVVATPRKKWQGRRATKKADSTSPAGPAAASTKTPRRSAAAGSAPHVTTPLDALTTSAAAAALPAAMGAAGHDRREPVQSTLGQFGSGFIQLAARVNAATASHANLRILSLPTEWNTCQVRAGTSPE